MKKLRQIGDWLKANVWTVLVALGAALGAGIFWSYHRGKVRSLKAQAAVEAAHRKAAALDAKRQALEEAATVNAAEIQTIQDQRRELQRETVALEHDITEMSDDEVEAAFRAMY